MYLLPQWDVQNKGNYLVTLQLKKMRNRMKTQDIVIIISISTKIRQGEGENRTMLTAL